MILYVVMVGCRSPDPVRPPPEAPPELAPSPCVEPGDVVAFDDVAWPVAGPRGLVEVGDIDGDGADELVWIDDGHIHTSDGHRWAADTLDVEVGDLDGDGVAEIVAGGVLRGGFGEFECEAGSARYEVAEVFDGVGTSLATWSRLVEGTFCLYDEFVEVTIGPQGYVSLVESFGGLWVVQGLGGGELVSEARFRAETYVRASAVGDLLGDGTVEVALYSDILAVYPIQWGAPDRDAVPELDQRPSRLSAGADLGGGPAEELRMLSVGLSGPPDILDPLTGEIVGDLPAQVVLADFTGDGYPDLGKIRALDSDLGGWEVTLYEGPFEGFAAAQTPWLQIDVPSDPEYDDGRVEQLSAADLDGDGVPVLLIGRGGSTLSTLSGVRVCR